MKTKTLLRILVTEKAMLGWPEVKELVEKGHTVDCLPNESFPYHLILGPTCWWMAESVRKYFKLAVAAAKKQAGR